MQLVFLSFMLTSLVAHGRDVAPPITAVALAPGGKQVVLASQAGVDVRSWPELVVVSSLATRLVNVHDLRFSPDGRTLLVAGGSPAEAGIVEAWDWLKGERILETAGHDDLVYRVSWSPDGTRWATAGADGVCQVFDAATGKPLIRYAGHSREVLSIRYLDAETIASAGVDQTVRLWSSRSAAHLRTLDNHVDTVNDIVVCPGAADSTPLMIATIGEDRTVRLWQPMTGRLVRFVRLPSTPRAIVWSVDGSQLLVGCNDGHIRIVDPDNMVVVGDLDGLSGRVFDLAVDPLLECILVAGEQGCRRVKLPRRADGR